ncbi:MAG TPA: hypothetical protein VFH45_09645 [Acidimicrobiales bacterium]|nr:hypothetical protein [Acidimicrobiales bacterium]
MPNATDSATRSAATRTDRSDALDEAHRSLYGTEGPAEEAVAGYVHVFGELMRALIPGAVVAPARALDVVFELVQQSIDLQRRLLQEVVRSFQGAMAEAAADRPYEGEVNGRRRPPEGDARRAAMSNAA